MTFVLGLSFNIPNLEIGIDSPARDLLEVFFRQFGRRFRIVIRSLGGVFLLLIFAHELFRGVGCVVVPTKRYV